MLKHLSVECLSDLLIKLSELVNLKLFFMGFFIPGTENYFYRHDMKLATAFGLSPIAKSESFVTSQYNVYIIIRIKSDDRKIHYKIFNNFK